LLFDRNAAVVSQRDDAENRAVALKVATGDYDDAIRMMTGRHFAVAEGANLNVAEHWTDAHILRAEKYIQAKRYQDALADLQAAVTIPENLPLGAAGFGAAPRKAEMAWWTGVAYDGLGDRQKANDEWGQAAHAATARSQEYYQGLALQKLGQADRAKTIFAALVESGKAALQQPAAGGSGRGRRGARAQTPRARTANAHYLTGLGYLGLNEAAQAKAELKQAVEISPDLVGARVALSGLE
jgi:tetratricopeptide (TPR) repeat protein